eukprot:5816606-Pyramimonas_sp.AAC.1
MFLCILGGLPSDVLRVLAGGESHVLEGCSPIRACLRRGPSGFIWSGEAGRRFGGRWPGARVP